MTLYHYTDLNAVHSILNTHKIRMTDIRFLNDKTEYLQGLEILKEASHDALKEKLHYDDDYLEALSDWFEKAFKELFDFENASEIFYVASWTDPTTVDKFCPHDEACSKASGLRPPR